MIARDTRLVLLPGLATVRANTGLLADVQRCWERLALRRYGRVAVLDYSMLGEYATIELLADAVVAQLRDMAEEPVVLVGHSTGGSLALLVAMRVPELVERLVLVSAAGRLGIDGQRAQHTAARMLRAGHVRAAALALARGVVNRPFERLLLSVVAANLPQVVLGARPGKLAWLLALEDTFDVMAELAGVQVPTVIVGGALDGFYSPELFEQTAAMLANAQAQVVRDRGHLTTWSPVLRSFLRAKRHPTSS